MVVSLLAAGCAADSGQQGQSAPAGLATFYEQQVRWRGCGDDAAGFECATVEVPLDYDAPEGERLEIAVKRLPAADGHARGSLLVNPGGPGGSGVDYVSVAGSALSERLRAEFDIVGFDPRGVGESSPVRCLDRDGLDDYLGHDAGSDGDSAVARLTPRERAELAQVNREFVEACERRSGELLPHMDTVSTARDMDVLRGVLGDTALTYLGKSYGTYLGAVYADLFPERVRALALDGAIDPNLNQLQMSLHQAEGFTLALEAFIDDCLSLRRCPLARGGATTAEQATANLSDLLVAAQREPLATTMGDGREVNRTRVETALISALYNESYWPRARDALADAFDGDGTALLRLADQLYDREPGEDYENTTAALIAVNCSDHPNPRDIDAYADAAAEAAEIAPLFGPSLAWGALPCAYWPAEATVEPVQVDAPGAAPILVVGTTRDPATPYQWAQNLAGALESGVLLTHESGGHTAYRSGSVCVDETVDTYLIEAEPPEDATVCR
ncbi:alpha/beta hydrolase [Salinactinospora qingdaonensis]